LVEWVQNPEVKNTQYGNVANFSVATSEKWKDKTSGETKESTEWVRCVLWNNLADIAGKYLHKGDLIYVEGKLKTKILEKDGTKHYITEVLVNNLVMLGTKGQSQAEPPRESPVAKASDDFFSNQLRQSQRHRAPISQ